MSGPEDELDLDRLMLLKIIEERMRKANIFYTDIWDRMKLTETRILKEIVDSDFEMQVMRMRKQ